MSEDGRVWTPGAVDFFRILNEQTGVVAEVNRDALLLRVAQVGRGGAGRPFLKESRSKKKVKRK